MPRRAHIGEPARFLREVVFQYEGDDCLPWPYSKDQDGYGLVWLAGRQRRVSRVVCEERHGAPPTPKHEAAHSCGKGHEACCTKRHLSWKTSAENKADMAIHGTQPRGRSINTARLTEEKVRQIRALKGSAFQHDIAKTFGISKQLVGRIHRGEIWTWLE